ncbi:hypothetical protein F2Q70_00002133 [Brassica cretica]|uniref:Uncharacterized protein n=1 Tax=Brassica cretica TaxID=69181 RepID=A0A8S9J048_BRACR|nr:hypothetical protein F2Q70_00002133 [Brassica cretica]
MTIREEQPENILRTRRRSQRQPTKAIGEAGATKSWSGHHAEWFTPYREQAEIYAPDSGPYTLASTERITLQKPRRGNTGDNKLPSGNMKNRGARAPINRGELENPDGSSDRATVVGEKRTEKRRRTGQSGRGSDAKQLRQALPDEYDPNPAHQNPYLLPKRCFLRLHDPPTPRQHSREARAHTQATDLNRRNPAAIPQ